MIPRFYPILDTAAIADRGGQLPMVAETLLNLGVRILQYRHKNDWTQLQYDEAAQLAVRCREAGATLVVNDRADYAHLVGAGVHLGQDDLSPVAARKVMGEAMIGISTHNKRQLAMAAEEPVEYLAVGPIFPTTSKLKPDPVVGLERLKTLRSLTDKPLVAIGGITLANSASVFEAGADSAATISGFLTDGCKPGELKKQIKRWLSV